MEVYVSQFMVFILMFARIASLIVVAPILGHQAIPAQLKVALALFLTFVLFPMQSSVALKIDIKLIGMIVLVLQEICVGLIIGFAVGLLFAGIHYAGELIGFDMGYSIASVYDPEMNATIPVVGEVLYTFMALVFLALNGHHFILQALQLSYKAVPIGGFSLAAAAYQKMVSLSGLMFAVAVKFAAPVIVAMFLTNIALAIITRVMPQMNIFGVAFPLKIGVGLVVLMTSAPVMVFVFKKLLLVFENNILELVRAL
ncbi:MAG: flagellar biosynthetic protein FliR [Ignavibacteriales bacterium]|nr:flagellar biosynthetic protein FliR [Ignavibacteriales bacterium]